MFTRLPSKNRHKKVYLYIDQNTQEDTSAGGDQDIPSSSDASQKQYVALSNMKHENENIRNMLHYKDIELENLQKLVLQKTEEIDLLQKVKPSPFSDVTTVITPLSNEIANIRLDLEKTRQQLESTKLAYIESKRTINRLVRQFTDLTNIVSPVSQPSSILNNENSIENLLISVKQKMQETLDKQTALFTEKEMLSNNLAQLEKAFIASQEEKDEVLNAEKSKTAEILDRLQSAQQELREMHNNYNQCVSQSDMYSSKTKQAYLDLKSAQQEYARFQQTCQDRLAIQSKETRAKILSLETENDLLMKEISLLKSRSDKLAAVSMQSDSQFAEECDKARKEMLPIVPFLARQIQIFDATKSKGSQDSAWLSFLDNKESLYEAARAIVSEATNSFTDDPMQPDSCANIVSLYGKSNSIYTQVKYLENVLVNMYENISGAVRIYVRLRPLASGTTLKTVSKEGKSVIYNGNLCKSSTKTYGRFFGVIPDTFSNADVYSGCNGTIIDKTEFVITGHGEEKEKGQLCCLTNDASGMCRVFNQLAEGYHIILFGYGHSGSGKTQTLLGSNDEPGLTQLAISNAKTKIVNLKGIFELSHDKIDIRSKNFNSGKFINLFQRGSDRILKDIPSTMIHNEENSFNETALSYGLNMSMLKKSPISASNMSVLKIVLDNYRMSRNRIMATPNNPQSSRSHLFIVLEFVYNNTKGLLTVVDMGGREMATDILEMYLDKPKDRGWQLTSLLLNDPKLYPKYLSPHKFTINDPSLSWFFNDNIYKANQSYANTVDTYVKNLNTISHNMEKTIEVIKESMFINETINQLTLFFKMKQDASKDLRSFGMKEHQYPIDEIKNKYDPMKFLTGIPTISSDRMGMFRILNVLSKYGDKPSKFVMICNVRQEATPTKFCMSSRETLEFAHSIRST